jgi:signal transduction histidine kinase
MSRAAAEPVSILLVDDQPAKLLSYEAILGDLGETLLMASSASEAFAQLLKNDVALVLLDVQMPDLDGFELAALIREHPRFQKTALMFVSAIHLSELDFLKGYEIGAVDYVQVPVVPAVLRAKVRVFAELHRKTRQLERLNAELEQRVGERTAELEASGAALKQLNEELEARIEQGTRERETALSQLFEAQKIDTIGQLTGGVAHDFNNLLMAMMSSLQLLKKRFNVDSAALRLIDNALQGAERGAALTQRLLAFARRQELKPGAIDVGELVAGMGDLLGRAIGPTVEVTRAIGPDLPRVKVDGNQLELALLNLALNARDALPEGGHLTIAAEAEEVGHKSVPQLEAGAYVRLTIEDDGHGMDEATCARASEPFFTTKGVGKGTGLGLSMVHGLAAQSGGALRLTSRPGQGTRVELWLPQAAEEARVASPEPPPAAANTTARAVRVLVVDDDILVSTITAAMLEDLGHVATVANSGAEALDRILRGEEFDLVVTDQAMPGMTGTELARRLGSLRPGLDVVLATGYSDIDSADHNDLALPKLSKPFLQGDLSALIATTLSQGRPKAA